MKKYYKLIVPIIAMLILSVFSEKLMSQPDPPPLPDRHGYNGNPSPQGAPLNAGSEILLGLGMVYAAMKASDRKKKRIIVR